eukprot:jgi/Botrbrau1/20319/Bobra.0006s0002.1
MLDRPVHPIGSQGVESNSGEERRVPLAIRRKRSLEETLAIHPEARTPSDLEYLDHILTDIIKWRVTLPQPARLEICKKAKYASYDRGNIIFRQGDIGYEFFIIVSGSVQVSLLDEATGKDKTLATLTAGDSFGELALVQGNSHRRATVTATAASTCMTLDGAEYQQILQPYHESSITARVHLLQQVEQLCDVPPMVLESLACVAVDRMYTPGQIVSCQGQELDDLFVICSGSVKAVRELDIGTSLSTLSKQMSYVPTWMVDKGGHPIQSRRLSKLREMADKLGPHASKVVGPELLQEHELPPPSLFGARLRKTVADLGAAKQISFNLRDEPLKQMAFRTKEETSKQITFNINGETPSPSTESQGLSIEPGLEQMPRGPMSPRRRRGAAPSQFRQSMAALQRTSSFLPARDAQAASDIRTGPPRGGVPRGNVGERAQRKHLQHGRQDKRGFPEGWGLTPEGGPPFH